MFHVKHLLFYLILIPHLSFSQGSMEIEDKPFALNLARNKSIDSFLSQIASFKEFSPEEQAVFYWVNFLRNDPAGFKNQVILPFLTLFPEANTNYAKSLLKDLDIQSPLQLIEPSSFLGKETARHAKDLALKQKTISHSSSDGRSFQQRMNDAQVSKCAGENILEGKKDALKAVIMLLIDQGVPDKGHRKALLNPDFNLMACSILAKKNSDKYIQVQLFSCR
jgi:Cysteine-rich secretory protein family